MRLKLLPLVVLVLAAMPAPAQNVILGVVETGDYTIAIDTVEFYWGTIAPAQFAPEGFGGPPSTSDSFRFEMQPAGFPPNVWIDFLRNGARMPRETIIGLNPDVWYNLPGFDNPTRIKFLPNPGIEESRSTPSSSRSTPTVVRNVLVLPQAGVEKRVSSVELLDMVGQKVMSLHTGPNDVRGLAPGVYFVRGRSTVGVQKVILN